jgi:hypothetical protein
MYGPTGVPHGVSSIGPVAMTVAQLPVESKIIQEPVYWAGPEPGYRYEFTRSTRGPVYVRYLPKSVRVGVPSAHYLIVATYPMPEAFARLEETAGDKAIAGPDGSIVYLNPVLGLVQVAFPTVDDLIEVYAPSKSVALATARSGNVVPVYTR